MKEMIDTLVSQLGVTPSQARGGAGVILRAAQEKLGAGEFTKLLGGVPGLDALLREAPAAGGLGRLLGGLASAMGGGNAAILANVVSSFGRLGLSADDAKKFLTVIEGVLRQRIGDNGVAKLEKAIRG